MASRDENARNRNALLEGLGDLELDDGDRRAIEWLSGWEPHIIDRVASWPARARAAAGRAEA